MLYPERMKSVDIIVEKSKLDYLLKELHRAGIMEIADVQSAGKDYMGLIERSAPPSRIREISSLLTRAEEVLADFSLGAAGAKGGIKRMIFPEAPEKVPVKRKGYDELREEAESILKSVESHAEALAERIAKNMELMERRKAQLHDLKKIASMDIDLSLLGRGEYVVAKIGEIREIHTLRKEMSGLESAFYEYTLFYKKKKVEKYAVLAVCYIKEEDRLNAALRKAGFQEFDFEGLKGSPQDAERTLLNEIAGLEKDTKKLREEMHGLSVKWRKRLAAVVEELQIERDRLDAISSMGRTRHVYVISGWVPVKSAPNLEKLVKKVTESHALVFFEDPKDEDVPVKMSNPKWARPFEFLTRMFAPPRYSEIDPTTIIAPIFVIYFGLMLGDALYGVIITIGGLIIYKGMGRVDRGARDFGMVITLAGISTVIFGILQGGYFGPFNEQAPDLFQLLGLNVPSLLDSMRDPITMLVIGLIIGLFHLNLGLLLGAIQNIRKGDRKEALLGQGTWWVLQPGAFILIAGKLFRWFEFSSEMYTLAWVLVIIGLIMLIMHEKWLFFFGITGFLGNFLSYARILALGLGTAGIALTVNILTYLVVGAASESLAPVCGGIAIVGAALGALSLKKPKKRYKITGVLLLVIGLVGVVSVPAAFMLVGAIMFIAGHIINTGLQALGSFVHSLRLQYVEFFGYFYEGGGKEFEPYMEKRKITEVKEVYE